jgi:hypothetical protein
MTADGLDRIRPKATPEGGAEAAFGEPAPYGYVYLGMRVDPPGRIPIVRASAGRRDVLTECARLAGRLDAHPEVVSVNVYEAVVIPPLRGSPRFDVLALVQTTSPAAIAAVQSTEAYRHLERNADFVMPARHVRRVGDIDHSGAGAFLFNHFAAADAGRALAALEDVGGWYIHKTGVTDSALLQPTGGAGPYAFVSHIHLPCGPIRFLLRMISRPSFWTFVTRRLKAGGIGIGPVICKSV